MLYTYGLKDKYDKALAKHPTSVHKAGRHTAQGVFYPGGAVFRTPEDVRAYLRQMGWEAVRDVYGVDADWERDTYEDSAGPFRRLLRNARVVKLNAPTDHR